MSYRPGTMMDQQLLLKTLLWRAERWYLLNTRENREWVEASTTR